jgi:hypothetical protein
MGRFTTRVELHYADDDDYETLHAAMEDEGFSRIIVTEDGAKYHLPTAEYDRRGQLTKQDVLNSAMRAATLTGRKFAVLVTESNGRTWEGLERG